jgi:carbon monoxide dehydrogenase subunit G
MTWIEGSESRDYTIDAPLEEVADFFSDPERFHTCVDEVESIEQIDDDTWHWRLEEMSVKGVGFQGEYDVRYDRDGDEQVVWETIDGNMRSEGEAVFEALGDGRTRVRYEETLAADLSIPSLMGSVIKPIASRMIGHGINSFLDGAKERLEDEHR